MASAAPLVPQRTFFKRPLPTSCTAFASPEGKALFAKALAEGNLESYFTLAPQMVTQNEPAFCAVRRSDPLSLPAEAADAVSSRSSARSCRSSMRSGWTHNGGGSLAGGGTTKVRLGSLLLAPEVPDHAHTHALAAPDMLDCCRPLSDVAAVGLTMSEFACLSLCNGLRAVVHTPLLDPAGRAARRDEGLAQFREDLRTTSRGKGVIALSYSRKTLGQTGDGHFSPIGGWCEEEDMVLVLDVARFKSVFFLCFPFESSFSS